MKSIETRFYTNFLESPAEQEESAAILREGGLVVMPTETVYGLGANALDPKAVRSIFTAKGRPADNPLIVHLASIDQLPDVTHSVPEAARILFARFSPGPLTLVLPRSESLADVVTGGLQTVGIRIPSHPVAHLLLSRASLPVAAPSANRSGRVSPTNFHMACLEMEGRVNAIIDGGSCQVGLESTVAQVTDSSVVILRPGAVTFEMIQGVLGDFPVRSDSDDQIKKGTPVLSPGMKYAHYQPDAEVYIWDGGPLDDLGDYQKLAVIGMKGSLVGVKAGFIREYETVEEYCADFYSVLDECDAKGLSVVVAESVEETGMGRALMNRLKRSAAGKKI